jgi:hypothetical protein
LDNLFGATRVVPIKAALFTTEARRLGVPSVVPSVCLQMIVDGIWNDETRMTNEAQKLNDRNRKGRAFADVLCFEFWISFVIRASSFVSEKRIDCAL